MGTIARWEKAVRREHTKDGSLTSTFAAVPRNAKKMETHVGGKRGVAEGEAAAVVGAAVNEGNDAVADGTVVKM